jgi:hypothetical protein
MYAACPRDSSGNNENSPKWRWIRWGRARMCHATMIFSNLGPLTNPLLHVNKDGPPPSTLLSGRMEVWHLMSTALHILVGNQNVVCVYLYENFNPFLSRI